jgi:hypothetical protein
VEVLYDALPPHVAMVIVVDPNRKDHGKPNFVGEISPFFPLCIDEGSFCSMPNRERGTATVIVKYDDERAGLAGAIRASAGRGLRD